MTIEEFKQHYYNDGYICNPRVPAECKVIGKILSIKTKIDHISVKSVRYIVYAYYGAEVHINEYTISLKAFENYNYMNITPKEFNTEREIVLSKLKSVNNTYYSNE